MLGWEPIGASIEQIRCGGDLAHFQHHIMREVLFGGTVLDPLSTWEANEIEEGATVSLWFGPFEGTLEGHSINVTSLAFLGEGKLASGSDDKTIKIWNTETGNCERTLRGHSDSVRSLAFLGEGRLASGSDDNTIKIWTIETGSHY